MAKLVYLKRDGEGEAVALDKPRMSLGRKSDNDIWIMDEAVSGLHARVEFRDGAFVLEDQISTNGTYLNGDRITRRALRDGDIVGLGNHKLKFVAETEHEWPTTTTGTTQSVDSAGDHTQFVPLSQLQSQYQVLGNGAAKPGLWRRILRLFGGGRR